MENIEQEPVSYAVYPAALFDGWEVVKEGDECPASFGRREQAIRYAKTQAAMNGGGVVKLENWFGDVEKTWEVAAPPLTQPEGALAVG